MSIKTLHFTNSFHPTSGGISAFYRALLEASGRHRRPVRLVVPGEATRIQEVGDYGRIYYLEAPRSPFIDETYRLLLPHTFLMPGKSAIREILRQERPDLIEVCDKYSLIYLASFLRKGWIPNMPRPTLVGLSCERMDENVAAYVSSGKMGRRFARLFMKWIYLPMCDYHIANSDHTAAELLELSLEHTRHRREVVVKPMGVDGSGLSPGRRDPELRRRLEENSGGGPHSRLLLYAGRLAREKNLPLLIGTMERLQEGTGDYRLLVAGQGPLERWMHEQCAARVPGRCHFLGYVGDRDELAGLYATADAFLHPNPREPFGIAPLEAMASGLPLVAPSSGGLLSYAGPHNAWLAAPDPQAFAAAVRSVFADPLLRRSRTENARQTALRYNWENVTSEFFELYDQLHARFQRRQLGESEGHEPREAAVR